MTIDSQDRKNIQTSLLFFTTSTLLTWWFIESAPYYDSLEQKLLSCFIAGAKWTIQILFALFFLQGKKWTFIKHIGLTCFIGSLLLLPYCINSMIRENRNSELFIGSLITSVAVMILLYFISVRKSGVPTLWWAGWMFCLALAITLQMKVVFNLSIF